MNLKVSIKVTIMYLKNEENKHVLNDAAQSLQTSYLKDRFKTFNFNMLKAGQYQIRHN